MKPHFHNLPLLVCGALLFAGISFGAGIYIEDQNNLLKGSAFSVQNGDTPETISTDFAPFWKAWEILKEKQVGADKITDDARMWGAIKGLAGASGDPYTVFFDPEESKAFAEEISGEFQGVGMEVGIRDQILTVIAPLKGTPAERAGIKAGDKILKIDDTVTNGLSVEEAVKKIRGPKGTSVRITILRDQSEEPLVISIERAQISIPTIETKVEGDVFVISLYNFSAQASMKFREALREFLISGKKKLIIDLRGNPGGYLDAAVDIGSWFVPLGKPIVSETRDDDTNVDRSRGYNIYGYSIFGEDISIAVLINQGSASASEILAGALQDHKKAIIVGETSFGKGSVQELIPVTGETSLKVTIAQWYTPNDNSISEKGITPDVVVKDTRKKPEDKDVQLEKAIELLGQ